MDKFLQMGTKSGGRTLASAPHWSRSYTSKGHKVGPNQYVCANICMIWAATTDGEYKDDQITSIEIDYHANMVVIGHHATIINKSGKISDVRPFLSDCSKLESVPIITFSSPRRTFLLHALSFEYTSKLCITFLIQFSVYFHI